MIRTLLRNVRQYKRDTILTPIFTGLEVFMEILIPFVAASIIDKGIEGGDMDQVIKYGLIMVVLALVSLATGILAGKYAATASTGFAANLRETMYEKIQTFSFSNIDRFSTAGLITRMTTDVTNLQNAFQMVLRVAVRAPLMLVCSVIMSFVINVKISIVFVIVLFFLAAVLLLIMRTTMPIFDKVFSFYDELNASVQENVTGIRVVKAFVREDYENSKFTAAATKLASMFIKAEGILAFNGPVMMLSIYGCMIALSWLGAHYIVIGTLTTGNLTSLFSYIMSMLFSLMMLSMIFVMLTISMASARRIAEVLDEEPDMKDTDEPLMTVKDGSIDFDHVSFSYTKGSGEDTLHDIDIHIASGETIGIIGGTGCGKTSLVSLISRLYDATDGTVRVGGVDVREIDMETLRDKVSVVLQKNVLFSGTILDNLRWGNENATKEECIRACEMACASEFIDHMPDGYDTWIEQGGTNVSGGQKQRLCIARALLKNPKILILDDSTSAVDTATDAKIRRSFAEELPEMTKLIISQRISSIQDADRIIVMEDGRVDGFDTHENLLKNNEIYREINEAQMQAGGDFDRKE